MLVVSYNNFVIMCNDNDFIFHYLSLSFTITLADAEAGQAAFVEASITVKWR